MSKENIEKQDQTQETPELLKSEITQAALALVNEALAEVDRLEKSDVNEDPEGEGIAEVDPMAEEAEKSEEAPAAEEHEGDEDKDEEDKEEAHEEKEEPVAKSEEAPKAETKPEVNPIEDLRKSTDERFDKIFKSLEGLSATVEKLAKTRVGRKGTTAVAPLQKSEEADVKPAAPQLKRHEVVSRLIKAQADGKPVTPVLVAKVEMGQQLTKSEYETVKALIGQ